MGKKAAPNPNIGRVDNKFIELFQRFILLSSKIFVKLGLLNLSINCIGKKDNIKSVKPANIDKYFPKKNKIRRKIIMEDIINILLTPNITGIEISIPLSAFLDVVKTIV